MREAGHLWHKEGWTELYLREAGGRTDTTLPEGGRTDTTLPEGGRTDKTPPEGGRTDTTLP